MRLARISVLAVISLFAGNAFSQATKDFNNTYPTPYRTFSSWAELPKGMTWPAIAGAQEGPDGNLYVLTRCHENSCAGRMEPAVLVYDLSGKLLSSWGSGLFNFPHGFWVDRDGNLWITDARAENGKGNQVFKFSAKGELLLTIGKAGVTGNGEDTFNQPCSVTFSRRPMAIFLSATAIVPPVRTKRATTAFRNFRRTASSL